MKNKEIIRWFQCLPDGTPIFETAGVTKLESRAKCAEKLYRGVKDPVKLMRKEGAIEKKFKLVEIVV